MVEATSNRGLWTIPSGKTPHATLHASILREINTTGAYARFKKVDRGQFAAAGSEAHPRPHPNTSTTPNRPNGRKLGRRLRLSGNAPSRPARSNILPMPKVSPDANGRSI